MLRFPLNFWRQRMGRKAFAAGLAGPCLCLFLFGLFAGGMEGTGTSVWEVNMRTWSEVLWRSGLLGPLLSLAVLPNLALFWWHLNRGEQISLGFNLALFALVLFGFWKGYRDFGKSVLPNTK